MKNALFAVEDRRYYEYKGVDLRSISRALYLDLISGDFYEGGSTITQQLAKNLFLASDKTLARKLKEAAYATQLERQPGSYLKPLSVYGPALEKGYTQDSMVSDNPININGYAPPDYDNQNRGYITMQEAVRHSWNIPAVWLLNEIGIDSGVDFAKRSGIPLEKEDNTLSLALGGLSKGVTPLQMAQAYGVFANLDRPTAGKTGSVELPPTQEFLEISKGVKDVWFVVYTPELTATVWMGYDNTDSNHYLITAGGSEPAVVFREILSRSLKSTPVVPFEIPQEYIEQNKLSNKVYKWFQDKFNPKDQFINENGNKDKGKDKNR
jgi:penicillin-binding protein 2A